MVNGIQNVVQVHQLFENDLIITCRDRVDNYFIRRWKISLGNETKKGENKWEQHVISIESA